MWTSGPTASRTAHHGDVGGEVGITQADLDGAESGGQLGGLAPHAVNADQSQSAAIVGGNPFGLAAEQTHQGQAAGF